MVNEVFSNFYLQMATGRTNDDDVLISEVDSFVKNRNINGIVTTLSPIKKSQDGQSQYAKYQTVTALSHSHALIVRSTSI